MEFFTFKNKYNWLLPLKQGYDLLNFIHNWTVPSEKRRWEHYDMFNSSNDKPDDDEEAEEDSVNSCEHNLTNIIICNIYHSSFIMFLN